jgi:UDP-N-acetylmuramoylalanine--D-glutamate ligase
MNIALAGFGQEGRASYDYWNNDGNTIVIADEHDHVDGLPDGAETILGADAFLKLGDFDLIIRSPGINPKKLPYGDKVWSATNEFFDKCPADIIGVTGTKGKGTTSSFIASILRAAGKTVHLVGNIGKPALAELVNIKPDDLVVYELSSFQLWDVKKSPHIAVLLMIEPDHLDVHDGMADYLAAKANITRYQTSKDVLVFNSTNEFSADIADEQKHAERREYPFDLGELASAVVLPGRHNLDNASAAVAAVQDYASEPAILREGLHAFTGLPHRLHFVAEKNGVRYYDDSIATTPGSAIAALQSFDEPKVIILGGHDKGADYTELIESCEESATTVITIGRSGPDLARLCQENGVSYVEEPGDMQAIVARAAETAGQGSVVILSPAAASFDMFKSYADRGEQFDAAVNSL